VVLPDFGTGPQLILTVIIATRTNDQQVENSKGARGEEFRDDLRGTSAAPRLSGASYLRKLLPADVLAELTRLSASRSLLAVGTTLGTIAIVLTVASTYFTWWIVVPAMLLIGIQQHALFVLAHDSAHYRLFETR